MAPVYNDWDAAMMLIRDLDRVLERERRTAAVLLIDDGSHTPAGPDRDLPASAITAIDVLHLRRNLGHQRAIAVGLSFIEQRQKADAVVVMDGDGEDKPEDVLRLLTALERTPGSIVFAERLRRSEGIVFALLYWAFRVIHRMLTGERVRVGNFSVIPADLLHRLVAVSDLWNHYAAAVFQARLPHTTIPTARGERYTGQSKMSFVGMVVHGLSAMSVFGDRIGVRLLIVTGAIMAGVVLAAAAVLGWSLAAGVELGPWAAYGALALLLLILLLAATSLGFVFVILAGRGNAGFLPFRDYAQYISRTSSWPIARVDAEYAVRRS